MPSKITCRKCRKPAYGGALAVLRGPGTGHEAERVVLCPDCLDLFRAWLAADVSRETEPRVIDKHAVAERFLEGGLAQ